ncbi:putative Septin spn3 [Fusarium oxysporum f. sp. albedinis]|nr:putative Septin spn3 [Fusarium oxysporum f. sp. albedinis]
MPTMPFLADALIAMSTCLALLASVASSFMPASATASLPESYSTTISLCHGSSEYSSIVSIRSTALSWASASFVNGDRYLCVSLTLSAASGYVSDSVCILT